MSTMTMTIPVTEKLEEKKFIDTLQDFNPNQYNQSQTDVDDPNITTDDPFDPNFIVRHYKGITPYPDFSDIKISQQNLKKLLDPNYVGTQIIDLDTSENYVDFIKQSNANMISSENEFNTQNDVVTAMIPELLENR